MGRGLLALALIPAFVAGPFRTLAVVIHDHGHEDTHVHAFARDRVDTWRHQHDHEHKHPTDRKSPHRLKLVDDDVEGVLIVFDPVVALPGDSNPRIDGQSVIQSASAPSILDLRGNPDALEPARPTADRRFAPTLRADHRIAALLQANHALLF
jgi:hypothetical protein